MACFKVFYNCAWNFKSKLKKRNLLDVANHKCTWLMSEAASDRKKETSVLELSKLVVPLGSITCTCADTAKTPAADIADVVIIDDNEQVQPMMNIGNKSPIPQPLPRPGLLEIILSLDGQYRMNKLHIPEQHCNMKCNFAGDACFSGGLLGPDGTNRYLGKWCKRKHKNRSAIAQDPSRTS